jgi:hypothetical protein
MNDMGDAVGDYCSRAIVQTEAGFLQVTADRLDPASELGSPGIID